MTVLSFQSRPNPSVIRFLDQRNWQALSQAVEHGVPGNMPYSDHHSLLEAFIMQSNRWGDEEEKQQQHAILKSFIKPGLQEDPERPHTLLTLAALAGRDDFVLSLLQAGLNPNTLAEKGHHAGTALAALHLKSFQSNFSWAILRQQQERRFEDLGTPEHLACLGVLCAYGLNIDKPTYRGASPLLLATLSKDTPCVHYLLACGANPTPKTGNPHHPLYGLTPLEVAILTANTEAMTALVYFGAPIEECSQSEPEVSLVGLAAKWGNAEMMAFLGKQLGVDHPLIQEAWWQALEKGNSQTAAWFLTHHYPVDQPNTQGNYPLHLAGQSGDERTLGLLLEKTSHPDQINDQGQTVWHVLKQFHPHKAYHFQLPTEEQKIVLFRRKT